MNSLLKSFLAILKDLESFELVSSEDVVLFSVSCNLPYPIIKSIADKYDDLFKDFDVSFELRYTKILKYNEFRMSERFIDTNDELELKLTINKKLKFNLSENVFLFFTFDGFYKQFDSLNTNIFEKVDLDKIISIHLPVEEMNSNSFIRIIPIKDCIIMPAEGLEEEGRERISFIRKIHDEVSRGKVFYPLPDYYYFTDAPEECRSWLNHNLFHASLLYLSNKYIEDDHFLIRGHKNCEICLSSTYNYSNTKDIYSIYRFCYEEKHYNDKIEIARNIFTIYLSSSDETNNLDVLLPKVEKTISSHFAAYIQDSIKKFFNDRKDVIKEAHKFASDLKVEADKLLTYINTSLVGVITAVFAGALSLSKGELWYLIAAFVMHALVFVGSYLFNKHHVQKRISDIIDVYDKYTSKFVVLAKDDLNEIKDIYIIPSYKSVEIYLKLYKRVIFALTVFMIILTTLGIYFSDSIFSARPIDPNTSEESVVESVYTSNPLKNVD